MSLENIIKLIELMLFKGFFFWFFVMVEWLGNFLLYFVMLFVFLVVGIVILSGIFGYFEVFVIDLCLEGVKGCLLDGIIEVILLLSVEGF